MNTGLQAAANLGWKLAAVLAGRASDTLLDTYQAERHPIGAEVLRTSGALIRLAMVQSRPGRLLRNVVARRLSRIPEVADRAAGAVSGIGVRYRAPRVADRLVGRRATDRVLERGRLHEALRDGRFVVVADEPPDHLPDHVQWERPLEPVTEPVLVRPDGYVAWVGDVSNYPFWPAG